MVIDELVVELGLDASKFSEGQKKALDQFKKTSEDFDDKLKKLEERNRTTANSTRGLTSAAEGLFTTLAGAGMASFARQTADSAAATGRMAINTGIATNELSAFGRMIERNGGNANAAQASMKGLADSMQNLKWGNASPDFLLGLSQIGGGQSDDPLALFFKFAKFAEGKSAQDVNQTGARLGLSADVINKAIQGSTKSLEDFRKASDGALSPDQVRKLTEMQESWNTLNQSLTSVGNQMVTDVAPGFTRAATAVSNFIDKNRTLATALGEVLAAVTALGLLKPVGWFLRLIGLAGAGSLVVSAGALAGPVAVAGGLAYANLPTEANKGEKNIYENGQLTEYGRSLTGGGGGAFKSKDERAAYIMAIAQQLGIDPKKALAVAKTEGFDNFVSTIPGETSYGAFQLHVTPGNRGGHLGDQFKKDTGLDPSNPETERQGISYALGWAKKNGWGAFHGAKNNGIGAWDGINKGGGDVTISNINLPGVTDARSFAQQLPGAIKAERTESKLAQSIATNANSGQRQ
jgi:hypothetical protein